MVERFIKDCTSIVSAEWSQDLSRCYLEEFIELLLYPNKLQTVSAEVPSLPL